MTPQEKSAIELAWAAKKRAGDAITRAKDQLTRAGLAKVPMDQIQQLDLAYQSAVVADAAALEAVADAMRAAGFNV